MSGRAVAPLALVAGTGLLTAAAAAAPDDAAASTRACREMNSNGKPKTPGYAFAVRSFAYWGALSDRDGMLKTARAVDRYARLAGGDSLCDPKKNVRPPRKKKRGGDGRGGGGGGRGGGGGGGGGGRGGILDRVLPPVRADDLLE